MNKASFRVLLVEDAQGDAELVHEYLAELGQGEFELSRVTSLTEALEAIAEGVHDIVLLDLHLPDSPSGIETVRAVCEACRDNSPMVLVLTGLDDQEVARESINECAQDFLIKNEITPTSLVRALRLAVTRHGMRVVEAIDNKPYPTPDDTAEIRQVLRRTNKAINLSTGRGGDIARDPAVVGDLATASRAIEVMLGQMNRKIDSVVDQQKFIRASMTESQFSLRKIMEENQQRDIDREKIRAGLRSVAQVVKRWQRLMTDNGKPGLESRLKTLEAAYAAFTHQVDVRRKTARDIFVGTMPGALMALVGLAGSAIVWYVAQRFSVPK